MALITVKIKRDQLWKEKEEKDSELMKLWMELEAE
jgi:hypothetical protein